MLNYFDYWRSCKNLNCDTRLHIMTVQQRMVYLIEPSVPSLRSKGSMRSWCIHDGYGAFLLMCQSTPVRGFDREEETLLEVPSG